MPQIPNTFIHGTLSALQGDIDDWCPTKPRRPIGPVPPKSGPLRDVLIAVAVSRLAQGVSSAKLRVSLEKEAMNLYNAGRAGMAG